MRPYFLLLLPLLAGELRPQPAGAATARFVVPERPVWQGEVFPLAYELSVPREQFYNLEEALDWDSNPLAVQEWSRPQLADRTVDGVALAVISYTTRAVAREAGSVPLNPGRQRVILRLGSARSGAIQQPVVNTRTVESAPAHLEVKALPAPAPADFAGAVGQFTLASRVSPLETEVGEPVTWTLALDGTGNWPYVAGLPPRSVSRDFRVPLQPEARRTSREGSLFAGALTEDVVLVPTRPGTHTLGPVTLSVFDPVKGAYQSLTAPAVTVVVTGTALTAEELAAAEAGTAKEGSEAEVATPIRPLTPIPRDPLPPAAPVAVPLAADAWTRGILFPLVLPLLAWLAFAVRRAWQTDPWRAQRAARSRLTATLRKLRACADPAARRPLLRRWQHDAAVLWRRDEAAPTPAAFDPDAIWSGLWFEAERELYAATPAAVPDDWAQRATAALAAKRVPAFSPLRIFHPHNLAPFLPALAAAGLLALTAAPTFAQPAPTPAEAYHRGDFAAAAAGWRAGVSAQPSDWSARHNLSLALGQQGRWGEAAGHAIAAFVQNPREPGVRAQLTLALDRAGYRPEEAVVLLQANQFKSVLLWASPAQWQRFVIAMSLLTAAGLILVLTRGYRLVGRRALRVGLGLIAAGAVGGAIGAACLRVYGPFARPGTLVVWQDTTLRSVPIEGEAHQETSALPAGAIAQVERAFLGWHRLTFSDGQTGWLRGESLVPVWQAPPVDPVRAPAVANPPPALKK